MILRCHRLMLCAFSTHFENALACTEKSAIVTVDIDPQITGVNRYGKLATKAGFDLIIGSIYFLLQITLLNNILRNLSFISRCFSKYISYFFSADLRNIVDFLYSGSIHTASRRYKILRQAAVTLGVAKLVDAIDEELLAPETHRSYSAGNT